MKPNTRRLHPRLLSLLTIGILTILLVLPFHAFLTVWLSSLVGHYMALRLWKELVLMLLLATTGFLLYRNPELRHTVVKSKLLWLIVVYLAVQVGWGLIALATNHVTLKALAYGWVVDTRFLIFFLITWVVTTKKPSLSKRWAPYIFWPALVVALLGILQYWALPYDALKHVGYNDSTIYPYETINHNIHHLRVMSSLRGANPLGAYLVLVISLVVASFGRLDKKWRLGTIIAVGTVTLVLTFSRSAWLGLFLGLLLLATQLVHTKRAKRIAWAMTGVLIAGVVILVVSLGHSTTFQDTIFHTNDHSTVATSSNEGHVSALKGGVHDVLHEPLGRGPGSAGPASVYNDSKVRIAENYFLQVGQEVGWLGLALFVLINAIVALGLWRRRDQRLALGLLAAFIGLTLVNLLSHAWTDDTLAYLWWGLAGIALAIPLEAKDEI